MDFTQYGIIEHDLALCHINDMVDTIHKTWDWHHVDKQSKTLTVDGFENR